MRDQKEQIAETFQKHFKHYGFKKTSVDEIASELKISKKTIYKHFSTKEKIFYYIISRVANQLKSQMEKELEPLQGAKAKVEYLIVKIFHDTRKWLKAGNDSFEFKYKYEISKLAFQESYNELLEEVIQEGNSMGEFGVKNVSLTIKFINGIFSESMKLISTNPDLYIEDDVIDSVFKLLKH